MPPKPFPAHAYDTRTQHDEFWSRTGERSQWNFSFTRPYWSVQMSCPCGPVTTAVCGPRVRGRGTVRGGR
ncbi:hypothetical protein WJ50_12635, partial [Burkholderia ubonensis]